MKMMLLKAIRDFLVAISIFALGFTLYPIILEYFANKETLTTFEGIIPLIIFIMDLGWAFYFLAQCGMKMSKVVPEWASRVGYLKRWRHITAISCVGLGLLLMVALAIYRAIHLFTHPFFSTEPYPTSTTPMILGLGTGGILFMWLGICFGAFSTAKKPQLSQKEAP